MEVNLGILFGISLAAIVFVIVTIVYALKWSKEYSKRDTITCPDNAGTLPCPIEGIQQTVKIDGLIFEEEKVTVQFTNKIVTNVSNIVVNIEPDIDTSNLIPTITNINPNSAVVNLTRTGRLPNVFNIEARIARNSGSMKNFLQVVPLNNAQGYGFIVPDKSSGGVRWFYSEKMLQHVEIEDGFWISGTIHTVPKILLVDDIPHILITQEGSTYVFLYEAKDTFGTDFKAPIAIPNVILTTNIIEIQTLQSTDKKVSAVLYPATSTSAGFFDLKIAVSTDGLQTTSVFPVATAKNYEYEPMFELQASTGRVFVGVVNTTPIHNTCDLWVSQTINTPNFSLNYSIIFSPALYTSVQWYMGSFLDGIVAILAVADTGENKIFTSADNFISGQKNLVALDQQAGANKIIYSFVTDNNINKIFASGASVNSMYFVQFQSGDPWTGRDLLRRNENNVSTAAYQISKSLALQAMYSGQSGITSVGLIGGIDKHTVHFSIVSSN